MKLYKTNITINGLKICVMFYISCEQCKFVRDQNTWLPSVIYNEWNVSCTCTSGYEYDARLEHNIRLKILYLWNNRSYLFISIPYASKPDML